MAKKTPANVDEGNLAKKVREGLKASESPEQTPALRKLRKRLKRAQRKRRRLESRKYRASEDKPGTPSEAAAST